MTRALRHIAVAALVALATTAPCVLAQAPPQVSPVDRPSARLAVEWDSLGPFEPVFGNPYRALSLAVDDADTLYVGTSGYGLYRLAPGFEVWSEPLLGEKYSTPKAFAFNEAGDLLVSLNGRPQGGIHRSSDGGRTWTLGLSSRAPSALDTTRTWATFGGLRGSTDSSAPEDFIASRDGGDTWAGARIGTSSGWGNAFVELPAGPPAEDGTPAWPENRVVAAVFDGIATSDDAGQTWEPSSLWYPFGIIGWKLAVPPDDAPVPVLASVRDADGATRLYASTDGGQTWEARFGFGFPRSGGVDLVWDGHGLWAGVSYDNDSDGGVGLVLHSADEGQTWTEVDWPGHGVNALAFDSRRVLYVATPVGVFRSQGPVTFPVANETSAPDEGRATLAVYPNPSDGSAVVALTNPEAAGVRVELFDVAGRRVALLHEGPLAAGTRTFRFEGTGLGSGTYIVRAQLVPEGGSVQTFIRRLTLVR